MPPLMKQAILAAEDGNFYQHGGIDFLGILRAAGANVLSGGRRQGASTITQQVARNFFLTSERTYTR
ncbi:MAG: transglycosylase domain-containing protein, partial [Desulfobulbus sp.]|nr:transglycosylase domain-containing protein [Desulfobulbus sp.]